MRGHIAKKGNKYYIVVSIRDDDGKRKLKWLGGEEGGFDRKKDAQNAMPEILHSLLKGTFVAPSGETFGELMTNWLEDKKTSVRYNTWKSYAWLVNTHLIPHLGHMRPERIKPDHIHRLYHDILIEKISPASIKKLHSVIMDALNRAVTWNKIPRNVAAVVELPKINRAKFQVWDEDQLDTFLEEARSSSYFVIYHTAANTGMRVSELLGLGRDDLHLDSCTASIRQALTLDVEGGHSLQNTKSEASERSIALFQDTVELLEAHLKRQEKEREKNKKFYKDHGLVFQTSRGTPINPRNLMRDFYRILDRLEEKAKNGETSVRVPRIRFHDLRHTHATLLLKRGVHPKIVQERLGHSSITITLDIYSHVLPNLQKAVLQNLGNSITGGVKNAGEKPL